jgi:hypothetical protein
MQVLAQEIVGPPLQSFPQVQVQQESPEQHVELEQSSQAGVQEDEPSVLGAPFSAGFASDLPEKKSGRPLPQSPSGAVRSTAGIARSLLGGDCPSPGQPAPR